MRPRVLGLTGTIGAGKSTVAGLLAELGAFVIDADALARDALERNDVRREIAEAFGPGTLDRGGRVDRAALAARVFDDADARRRLEAIVHPRVAEARSEAERRARSAAPPPAVIVHDVPLLFETGSDVPVDAVDEASEALRAYVAFVGDRLGVRVAHTTVQDGSLLHRSFVEVVW